MIMDLQWGPRSPIVMALQWYASISKLPLKDGPLNTLLGYTIHTMALAISAGLVLRFVLVLSQWPWNMLSIGDDRRPGDPGQVAKYFVGSRFCCVDKAGTGAVLRSMPKVRSFEWCSSPECQCLFKAMAAALDGLCDEVEVRHARNNNDSQAGVSDMTLSARYTLRESVTSKSCYEQSLRLGHKDVAEVAFLEDCLEPKTSRVQASKFGGFRYFHSDRLRRLGSMGEPFSERNPIPKSTYGQSRERWGELADAEQALYESLAQMTETGSTIDCESPAMSAALVPESSDDVSPHGAPQVTLHMHVPLLQSDFMTFSGGLNRNALVKAWSSRKPVREVLGKPVESATEPEEAAPCQDAGICKAAWKQFELPFFKFTRLKKLVSRVLRQRFAIVHGRPLPAKLLCFDGSVADVVHVSRFVWLSFANGSPVWVVS